MAKKKTSGSATPPAGAGTDARRGTTRGVGTAAGDQSPITGTTATTSEEVQLAVAHDAAGPAARQPSYDEIAEAAYRRYLSRGGTDGQDVHDWLEAERELNRPKE